ncbi:hypothetical protein ID853_19205, partial [Xenorhabdus sp. Vera]|nr:hypothetical protein [Xenorhabdus sp. Vera]
QREYERTGPKGAFNAGLETGRLLTMAIGYLAVVKGATNVTTRTLKSVSQYQGCLSPRKKWQ